MTSAYEAPRERDFSRATACAAACPARVRVFGDLSDPSSELYRSVHQMTSGITAELRSDMELKDMLRERDESLDKMRAQLENPGDSTGTNDPKVLKRAFDYERSLRIKLEREISDLNKKVLSLQKQLEKDESGSPRKGLFGSN